jgi:hypothetical protein
MGSGPRGVRVKGRCEGPVCVNCGTRILGHGVQNEQHMFCCAHCAQAVGVTGVRDRVASGS